MSTDCRTLPADRLVGAAGDLAGRLLGLPRFVVLMVADYGGEIEMMIETTESVTGCPPGPVQSRAASV